MDESDYIQRNTAFYHTLLKFIDSEIEDNQAIQEIFRNIVNDDDEIKLFILLISRICENHFRFPCFFKKIETIIFHFAHKIIKIFKNEEIYQLFKKNQRILLFLIQNNILTPVDEIKYNLYYYPEVKSIINKVSEKEKFENKFNEIDSRETFEEKGKLVKTIQLFAI